MSERTIFVISLILVAVGVVVLTLSMVSLDKSENRENTEQMKACVASGKSWTYVHGTGEHACE